jgi:hypothetical protein
VNSYQNFLQIETLMSELFRPEIIVMRPCAPPSFPDVVDRHPFARVPLAMLSSATSYPDLPQIVDRSTN